MTPRSYSRSSLFTSASASTFAYYATHSLASVDVHKEQLGLRKLTGFPDGLTRLCAPSAGSSEVPTSPS